MLRVGVLLGTLLAAILADLILPVRFGGGVMLSFVWVWLVLMPLRQPPALSVLFAGAAGLASDLLLTSRGGINLILFPTLALLYFRAATLKTLTARSVAVIGQLTVLMFAGFAQDWMVNGNLPHWEWWLARGAATFLAAFGMCAIWDVHNLISGRSWRERSISSAQPVFRGLR